VSAWRRKAIELLPEKRVVVEHADSPMALWIELTMAAVRAFEARPIGEKTLRSIFSYARYCWESPDGDVSTAVVIAFFEDIVTSRAARADLHRWISQEEFDGLHEPFRYHLSQEEFDEFAEVFRKQSAKSGSAG
jgi:hypothetical protein